MSAGHRDNAGAGQGRGVRGALQSLAGAEGQGALPALGQLDGGCGRIRGVTATSSHRFKGHLLLSTGGRSPYANTLFASEDKEGALGLVLYSSTAEPLLGLLNSLACLFSYPGL